MDSTFLAPDLRRKTFTPTPSWELWFFCRCPLSDWEISPLFLVCWEFLFLLWMDIEFYQMLFLYQLTWSCGVFRILTFWFTSIVFQILNHPSIPQINPIQSPHILNLIYCWIRFANVWLNIFVLIFMRDICVVFLYCLCLVLVPRVMPDS